MLRFIYPFFIAIFMLGISMATSAQVYLTKAGTATFTSEAPLEFITAQTTDLSGAVNTDDNRFAFRIANKSFVGFNSQLQQEHFYENYIETEKYKYSTFQGKIIENIDLKNKEPQEIRAKGILSIHGIEQERIIKATITILNNKLMVSCNFIVSLEDHNIRIPNVVYQKIAELIEVKIDAELIQQQTD